MASLLGFNKARLYLALYQRGANDNPYAARYHTCLILAPKDNSPGHQYNDSTRYHVVNSIAVINGEAKQIWKFEDKPCAVNTTKIVAVMLLTKLPSPWTRKSFTELLSTVPLVQDDPTWRCRHWVFSVMKMLCDKGILTDIQSEADAEALWNVAAHFADEHPRAETKDPVPLCNTQGQELGQVN